jgi:hypothetical protein
MLRYLETLPGCGDGSRYQVQETLMSDNPRSRPSLKDVLDGYGRYRVKRIAEAEKGGGVMQKKPRMMYSTCLSIFIFLLAAVNLCTALT